METVAHSPMDRRGFLRAVPGVLKTLAIGAGFVYAATHGINTDPEPQSPIPTRSVRKVSSAGRSLDDDKQRETSRVEKYGRVMFGNGCGAIPAAAIVTPDCPNSKTDAYFKDSYGLETRFVEFKGRRIRVSSIGGAFIQNQTDPKDVQLE